MSTTDYISLPCDATDSASMLCVRACRVASSSKKVVRFLIAGVPMEATEGSDPDDLFSLWWGLKKKADEKEKAEAQRAFESLRGQTI